MPDEKPKGVDLLGSMRASVTKIQAFAWLEKEFQERRGALANAILLYPYLDTLRSDPQYADLLRRMGLPQ